MNTRLQKFLLDNTLDALFKTHGVNVRFSSCMTKASYNCDQINAVDKDLLAQECRGIILTRVDRCGNVIQWSESCKSDEVVGHTIVMARPFNRFFNYGQEAAANVDFNDPNLRFFNKEDGTLTIVYHDFNKNEWHVATRGVPEADLPIDGYDNHTFRTLFERALANVTGYSDLESFGKDKLDRNVTYMFELCTPENAVVVRHDDYKVILLGARRLSDHVEISLDDCRELGVPVVENFKLGSVQEMIDFVAERNPSEYEGIVVCDSKFRRVKVKSPAYVALHRVTDQVARSPRGLMQIILSEKFDDIVPLLPQAIVERGEQMQAQYRVLTRSFDSSFDQALALANEESPIFNPNSKSLVKQHQKSFALAVQANGGWLAPLMDRYHGKCEGLHDYVMKRRAKGGDWANGFLDTLVEMCDGVALNE